MKNLIFIISICLALLTLSCNVSSKRQEARTVSDIDTTTETTQSEAVEELPLPNVPNTLIDPQDRAAYIVEHFWDTMEFTDTLKSRDEAFMEQNFANYVNLFGYTSEQVARASVESLMSKATSDRKAYNLLADIAEKYLYDPNSPMLDEEAYILFLQTITNDRYMDADRIVKFDKQLKDAMKNRRGQKASDFRYVDRERNKGSLYGTSDGTSYRLLMFYDPDCDVCERTERMLEENPTINKLIADGVLKILAVYSDGDEEIWEKSKDRLPENWISAYSPGGAVDNDEIYIIRATPTLYLLAPDNTVVLKDARAEEIIQAFN